MIPLCSFVVGASGVAFLAFTAVVFVSPALAERFLLSFASSARAHYVEMTFRLLMGSSLLALWPVMRPPGVFRVIGWAIVISSVALVLMPWQWHHRLGKRIGPGLIRYMRVYALGAFAFGCLLLFGVLSTGSPGAP